jgi:lysophospholipase L1-like esterase
MKTILCYGDSNTWGHPPIKALGLPLARYGFNERWPGVMRQQLGEGYWVIEEGLSGRTTVFDDPVEGLHKNGKTYLLPCLETHAPIDLVTIMLGTNDMKTRFAAPAFDIAWGMSILAGMVLNSNFGVDGKAPKLLIICPPRLGKLTAFKELWEGGDAKSALLASHYRANAEGLGCGFLDAGEIIKSSDIDGIHFEAGEHQKLGQAVAQHVLKMLG